MFSGFSLFYCCNFPTFHISERNLDSALGRKVAVGVGVGVGVRSGELPWFSLFFGFRYFSLVTF